MVEAVETIELKDETVLKIYQDDHPFSPREEYDNLTTIAFFHNKYNIGDSVDYDSDDFEGWDEMEDYIQQTYKPLLILPLYMYDHSGIRLSTSPFSCKWDSGQVGFVYITKKQIDLIGTYIENEESYEDYLARLVSYIDNEVQTLDQYVSGDVYSYEVVDESGEILDSCSGFYGSNWKKNGILEYVGKDLLLDSSQDLGTL